MDEIRSEVIGNRRVSLIAQFGDYYTVTIEVRGPQAWEDISLRADRNLIFDVASRRYRQRVRACSPISKQRLKDGML